MATDVLVDSTISYDDKIMIFLFYYYCAIK